MVHVPIISDFYDYDEEEKKELQDKNECAQTAPTSNGQTVKRHTSDYTTNSSKMNKFSAENSDVVIVGNSFHENNAEI